MREFMNLQIVDTHSPRTGEYERVASVDIGVSDIREGVIKKIGHRKFVLLLAITAHLNNKGEAFPSYYQLSRITGISESSVKRDIRELLEADIDGQPLLLRKMVGRKSVYSFYYELQQITPVDTIDNASNFIAYFIDTYKEVYGEDYVADFGKEGKRIRTAFIGKYSSNEMKLMIGTAIRNYDSKWKTAKFPRPSLGALISWLGVQALDIGKEVVIAQRKINELMEVDLDEYYT